ncbi:hypothetical protein RPALISO_116 [Ruegeria phage RpAliso]|nr:hypothetical protein RPALISO_116 [Ruegeria phage RpAliso]
MADAPKQIVIDMAGAMEKITPEMMDKARDIIIEGMVKSGTQMLNGLHEIVRLCDAGVSLADIKKAAEDAMPK